MTVPSGVFASSTFDQGFVIEDDTAGIYASTAENPNLNFHRRVRVTGTTADNGVGLLTVQTASCSPAASRKMAPGPIPTGPRFSRAAPSPIPSGTVRDLVRYKNGWKEVATGSPARALEPIIRSSTPRAGTP